MDPMHVPMAEPSSIDSVAFLGKARRLARRVGTQVLEKLLIAFYVMGDEATPRKARMTLAGALAYFLIPIDAVTDALPAVGLTDDGLVITLALAAVAASVRRRHVEQARQTMRSWGLADASGGATTELV